MARDDDSVERASVYQEGTLHARVIVEMIRGSVRNLHDDVHDKIYWPVVCNPHLRHYDHSEVLWYIEHGLLDPETGRDMREDR